MQFKECDANTNSSPRYMNSIAMDAIKKPEQYNYLAKINASAWFSSLEAFLQWFPKEMWTSIAISYLHHATLSKLKDSVEYVTNTQA